MKTIRNLVLFVLTVAVFASCGKTTYKKTAGGLPYKVFPGKDTQKVRMGNIMKLHFTQKIKDSVYFTSEGKPPVYFKLDRPAEPYDISEIWTSLKVGDSMVATQMMDTFIKRNPTSIPPQYKKGDRIITYVKILQVFTSDSAAQADEEKGQKEWLAGEIKAIEKFLADNKITAQKTPSGAYVQILNPGDGNPVDTGNYVSVNYTGVSWSGKKVDSNTDTAFHHVEPYSFSAGRGEMIKGFDEAVFFLKKGGAAKVWVPSILAYGGRPTTPLLKPYESMIFDLSLVDVKDKKPEAPKMQQPPPQPPMPRQ